MTRLRETPSRAYLLPLSTIDASLVSSDRNAVRTISADSLSAARAIASSKDSGLLDTFQSVPGVHHLVNPGTWQIVGKQVRKFLPKGCGMLREPLGCPGQGKKSYLRKSSSQQGPGIRK